MIQFPFTKSTTPYTPAQYGDRPELSAREERALLTQANRMRRWWTAYEVTCAAYGLPLGTEFVPCHCGHEVDAWRADVDHVTTRVNGTAGNVMLAHATCNRDIKGESAPSVEHLSALARGTGCETYPRVSTDAFRYIWNARERRQGNGDDYIA